jgi:hypothetical protein
LSFWWHLPFDSRRVRTWTHNPWILYHKFAWFSKKVIPRNNYKFNSCEMHHAASSAIVNSAILLYLVTQTISIQNTWKRSNNVSLHIRYICMYGHICHLFIAHTRSIVCCLVLTKPPTNQLCFSATTRGVVSSDLSIK